MPRKNNQTLILEATVSSGGQITLPRTLRSRLGIHTGSRIRFTLLPKGGFEAHRILSKLEDLWTVADQAGKSCRVLTFEKMNRAKARRSGR